MTDKFKEKAKDWDATERIKQLSAGIGSCILKNVALNDCHFERSKKSRASLNDSQ